MKDKNTAGIFALLLGGFGGHRFYLGETGWGIAYMFFCWTFIPSVIALFEGVILLTMKQEAFDLRYNRQFTGSPRMARTEPQNIVVNVAANAAVANGGGDVVQQIKELHDLKLAGALSDEEFTSQKRRLLERHS